MSMHIQASTWCELQRLRDLSARLGRNPLLTQASSGNTSWKKDGVLWIKASGKWLSQADAEDFWVPVSLEEAQTGICQSRTVQQTGAPWQGHAQASLETAMHAVIPQVVVIHVHSVSTIAWAVREDGPQQLSILLSGLAWQWIPYTPSGAPLARRVQQALACAPATNVLVLGNHGLVVSGPTCQAAEQLLQEVEQRLAIQPRYVSLPSGKGLPPSFANLAELLSLTEEVHSLAIDPHSQRILAGGVLYPCQALFLPGVSAWVSGQEERDRFPKTRAEQEMLLGLAHVVQRIDPAASLRYLTAREIKGVLGRTGDQYRRSANTNEVV